MTIPRGIRNNNPGNLRLTKDEWNGLLPGDDLEFFTFKTPMYGIRALAKVLTNYGKKYKLGTIKEVISRWAPPSENDTQSYIDAVCYRLGCGEDVPIELRCTGIIELLVRAIIFHENGQQPYADDVILTAIHSGIGHDKTKH